MQTLKHISLLNITVQLLLSLFVASLLFSCSKEDNLAVAAKGTELTASISSRASDRTSSVAIPYDWDIFVPCANGGVGEYVHVTGSTNLVYTISWTDHGFTYGYHANTYKIQGVGITSGEIFRGSKQTEGQVLGAWVNDQWLSTFVDQIRLIGTNTSFTVKNTYHVTVSPDGTQEIKLNDHEVTCN